MINKKKLNEIMRGKPFLKGNIPWNKGTKGICKPNSGSFTSEMCSDEKHWMWKGDKASYRAKHHWITHKLGKPDMCEYCGKKGLSGHSIHWANISKKYLRELSDWIRLCSTCHGQERAGLIQF